MSGEPLNSTIDPTLLQSLAQQHFNTAQLSSFSQLQITSADADSARRRSYTSAANSFNPSSSLASTMNDSSAQQPPAPINISRTSALSMAQQPLSGSAASFGTDYERGGLASSFQQMQQQHQFHQQQQQHSHQHNFFRTHLGSPVQQEMFSPDPDNISEISPQSSFQQHHSLAAMASGALPTSIPGAFLAAGSPRPGDASHMLRMPAFNASPARSPTFQSMSLPAHPGIFGSHLGQHQGLDSALDSSSFNAQYLGAGNSVEFSPQNQTLMSLMEGEDGESSQKSAIVNYEKRRRRRESHNAVERRRRDNINERIQDLYSLLPDMMIDLNTKPNKGVILKKSVEYIRQLQQLIQNQNQRIRELEAGGMSSNIQHQPQSSSGLAAMLAGAAGLGSQRGQPGDVNMMNSGL
ncbi:Cell morphogenesis protein PAG1 [Coemansia spiralis]|uniref:Cell morphogenesis protein PAG1 n=1 Tax=Coemansia spiralis TaxID=417178 RepID=A0A9W8GMR5_9FUNG|nr:Cell morphogenesis protein PAG1 [Coemansia spiralis]